MESQQIQDYTFKKGDFRMLILPSLGLDWNDNINLAQTNVMDDYIVKPAVGITASYPFSQRNLLYLDFSIGYDRYLLHPRIEHICIRIPPSKRDFHSTSESRMSR